MTFPFKLSYILYIITPTHVAFLENSNCMYIVPGRNGLINFETSRIASEARDDASQARFQLGASSHIERPFTDP